ncbi:unnamed protein product [Gordionus sp. m RMFG-2023]
MDGIPPELKYATINQRNSKNTLKSKINFNSGNKCSRPHFKKLSDKCRQLIALMGIPCLQSQSEAEKLCALLNSHNKVDGCISNDSDIILYGANIVYKNFDINLANKKKNFIKSFDCQKTLKELNLTLPDLIGASVLLGCDYLQGGVNGVGKEQVLKIISHIQKEGEENQNLMTRIHSWRQDPFFHFLVELENLPKRCTTKSSKQIARVCVCQWHMAQEILDYHKLELNIYKKVRGIPIEKFPYSQIADEFTNSSKERIPEHNELLPSAPNVQGILEFTSKILDWNKAYTLQKLLPYLVNHYFTSYFKMANREKWENNLSQYKPDDFNDRLLSFSIGIKPLRIGKTCVKQGIQYYTTHWTMFEFDNFTEAHEEVASTKDRLLQFYEIPVKFRYMDLAYPAIVKSFKQSKIKSIKSKVSKKSSRNNDATLNNRLITDFAAKLSLNENEFKNSAKNMINSYGLHSTKKNYNAKIDLDLDTPIIVIRSPTSHISSDRKFDKNLGISHKEMISHFSHKSDNRCSCQDDTVIISGDETSFEIPNHYKLSSNDSLNYNIRMKNTVINENLQDSLRPRETEKGSRLSLNSEISKIVENDKIFNKIISPTFPRSANIDSRETITAEITKIDFQTPKKICDDAISIIDDVFLDSLSPTVFHSYLNDQIIKNIDGKSDSNQSALIFEDLTFENHGEITSNFDANFLSNPCIDINVRKDEENLKLRREETFKNVNNSRQNLYSQSPLPLLQRLKSAKVRSS